jgi:hypothetical protein
VFVLVDYDFENLREKGADQNVCKKLQRSASCKRREDLKYCPGNNKERTRIEGRKCNLREVLSGMKHNTSKIIRRFESSPT